jgi:integrase/recombinase XerD
VTRLGKIMLEERERRNYTQATIRHYLSFVERFAKYFGKSPDKLGPDHLRSYQAYRLKERKLCPGSVENHVAALRFFFIRTLHRHGFYPFLPYPKVRRNLPNILSREEVVQLIEASSSRFERTLLMVLYGTGMRHAEITRLKIADIDSQRMIIHVVNGKGGKDRDLPLSRALLETLRA